MLVSKNMQFLVCCVSLQVCCIYIYMYHVLRNVLCSLLKMQLLSGVETAQVTAEDLVLRKHDLS